MCLKYCHGCGQWKEQTEFRLRSNDRTRFNQCRECENYAERVRMAKKRGQPIPERTDVPKGYVPRVWPPDPLNYVARDWRGPVGEWRVRL